MKYRVFGKTDEKVSEIILGGWLFGGGEWGPEVDDSESVKTIHAAIDSGITWVDTAEGYHSGHSEEVIGWALKDRRDKMCVATKVSASHITAEDLPKSCEASLKRLQTDYIDLYQVHWPSDGIPVAETMGALKRLQEAGKIRFIGVSNFSSVQMTEALKTVRIESLQPPYNLFWRFIESDQLPFCREHGISVIPYSPLAQGLLTGRFRSGDVIEKGHVRYRNWLYRGEAFQAATKAVDAIRPMAADLGCSILHLALAWLLAQDGITAPIVGARNAEQLAGILGAVDVKLTAEQNAELSKLGDGVMDTIRDKRIMWASE